MRTWPDIAFTKSEKRYDAFVVDEDCKIGIFDREFIIPKGYETDFASVPQIFWSLLPPHGLTAMASVVHDYMYDNRLFEKELGEKVARAFADATFLKIMELYNVPKWQRLLYYYTVRIFAGPWWRD